MRCKRYSELSMEGVAEGTGAVERGDLGADAGRGGVPTSYLAFDNGQSVNVHSVIIVFDLGAT